MNIFNKFPYTDFHELNLDYILKEINSLKTEISNFVTTHEIKFADPINWDKSSYYEEYTVVLAPDGNSYLSLENVPAGIEYNNEKYWRIIGNYNLALYTAKTVDDMKKMNYLTSNTYVETQGYYEVGDGGHAIYFITDDLPDSYYEVLENGKYAVLLQNSDTNVKQFGAHGNGIDDDFNYIMNALKGTKNGIINFPKGVYIVSHMLQIPSNITLDGHNVATIKASNDFTSGVSGMTSVICNDDLQMGEYANVGIIIKNITIDDGNVESATGGAIQFS